ncbi:MAG: hypothetical protein F6K30_30145 [Cyanothece sp. SIO2G6]|nr:hypothetical protein [Cyanothece sp. SIO2G6]
MRQIRTFLAITSHKHYPVSLCEVIIPHWTALGVNFYLPFFSQVDRDRDCDRMAVVLIDRGYFSSQEWAQNFVDETRTRTWEELFGPGSDFEKRFGSSDEEKE